MRKRQYMKAMKESELIDTLTQLQSTVAELKLKISSIIVYKSLDSAEKSELVTALLDRDNRIRALEDTIVELQLQLESNTSIA